MTIKISSVLTFFLLLLGYSTQSYAQEEYARSWVYELEGNQVNKIWIKEGRNKDLKCQIFSAQLNAWLETQVIVANQNKGELFVRSKQSNVVYKFYFSDNGHKIRCEIPNGKELFYHLKNGA